jgi:fatty-acyl-CoA synthase
VVGLDFAPAGGWSFEELLASGRGESRNPRIDLSASLLVVYTSGAS